MGKVGILDGKVPMILISDDKDVSKEDLLSLAESKGISIDEIEVVSSDKFIERREELLKRMEVTLLPEPDWSADRLISVYNNIPKMGVGRDDKYYSKKVTKRRKKNKNKKTHRRK